MRRNYALIGASLFCTAIAVGDTSSTMAATDLKTALGQSKRTGKPLLIVGTAPG